MFLDSDNDFLEKIDRVMADEDEARLNLFKFILELNDEDITALSRIVDKMLDYYNKKD